MLVRHPLLAASMLLAACIPLGKRPPTTIPAPIIADGRVELPPTRADLPPLVLEGPWEVRDGRACVAGGAVRLLTAAGVIPFDDAHLCVTTDPVSIDGEATVAFPALGFLAQAGVRADGRRARVHLALGSRLRALDLGGRTLRADPYHYYLFLQYVDGQTIGIGRASLATPGGAATLLIDAQEPLLYLAGRLSAPGLDLDAAYGFSPAGRLGFVPARTLRAPAGPFHGHLLVGGAVPLAPYPITVRGEAILDLDADDDGFTVLDGDTGDLALAINGGVALGYQRHGFALALEVGEATLIYDGRGRGSVRLAGLAGDPFRGTPLEVFRTSGRTTLDAHYQGLDDFSIDIEARTQLLGFELHRTRFTLDPRGVRVAGRLALPAGMGQVDVAGGIDARGRFDLRGRADLVVAGLRLLDAEVAVGASGVAVRGLLDLPGMGRVAVSGHVRPDGDVALAGAGDLRPAGLRLAGARVAVSRQGARIDGRVHFLGTGFAVQGTAAAHGFSLGGQVTVHLLIFRGLTRLTIGNTGARAVVHGRACLGPSCVDVAGLDLDSRGRICPTFPIAGRKCIKVM
jgi:hypothetical protein